MTTSRAGESDPRRFAAPTVIRDANEGLLAASQAMPPLRLADAALVCHHAHIAPGLLPAGTSSVSHRHGEIQLEFVLHGQMGFDTASDHQICHQGEGVLIGPLVRHSWQTFTPVVVLGVLVRVEGEQTTAFQQALSRQIGESLPRIGLRDSSHLGDRLGELLADATQVWRDERLQTVFRLWLADALAQALPLDDWHDGSRLTSREGSRQRDLLAQRAVEFIEANLEHPLQIEAVARQFGLSVRHLSRIFREQQGTCFQELLREARLRRAYHLLSQGEVRSVKEAAFSSGFLSPAYFTQCFVKEYQILPSDLLRPAD